MLRIYLDQFAWIRLGKAKHNKPVATGWADAYTLCRAAKDRGFASFPIDIYRYWETNKNPVDDSRGRLAGTIIELSDFDSIRVPTGILDYEIDVQPRRRFGRPHITTEPRVFGRSIAHIASGGVDDSMRPGAQRPPSESSSSDLRTPIDAHLEETLLRASPADHALNGLPLDSINFGDLYVQHELTVATTIARLNVKGQDLRATVIDADLRDIGTAINIRIEDARVTAAEVLNTLGHTGLFQLVHDMPTRRVTNNLRAGKHAQGQQKWKASDFVDVVSLPVPTVYCDVVLTEKQWVDSMKRERLDQLYDTRLISTPQQLVEVLMSATA